ETAGTEDEWKLIAVEVGVMSALEFRHIQWRLRQSDAQMAQELGCSQQHVRRMKVIDTSLPSHRPIQPTMQKLIEKLADEASQPIT
ncbi:MAG: hypothetical protein WBA88_23945, partial [Pseudaminobacter sp.]